MPGLEMPARGGGAAMLRELRDEERPQLEEHPQGIADVDAAPEDVKIDESYDNMTNKLTTKQTVKKANNQSGKTDRKQTVKPARQVESQIEGQSVVEMIRRRAVQREEQEVLKTVTLKLSPALDEKIEKYCFDHKMKKQEFWAEAATLYFEMIAQEEGG